MRGVETTEHGGPTAEDPHTPSRPELSIVIPVFNEAGTLADLHQRLSRTLKDVGLPSEMIFVDDGSTDRSA